MAWNSNYGPFTYTPIPGIAGSESVHSLSPRTTKGGLKDEVSVSGSLWRQDSRTDLRGLPGRPQRLGKKSRIIKWLVVDSQCGKQSYQLDKRQLIQLCGLEVPIRDMRLMDAALGYETVSQLLVRDNALVFSMEHVRMLITADKVIIPLDAERGEVKERFLSQLELSIADRALEASDRASQPGSPAPPPLDNTQPFELLVLETGLGEICAYLGREVQLLQAQVQPALEALTNNADMNNLEAVRRVKTQHQRLIGRVKSVHEVLERLMEDDGDMWRMCLTKQREMKAQTAAALVEVSDVMPALGSMVVGSLSTSFTRGGGGHSLAARVRHTALRKAHAAGGGDAASIMDNGALVGLATPGPVDSTTAGMADTAGAGPTLSDIDFLDVENLLESYFLQLDSTYQSLISIGEYIDDTEDLINIQLDYNRNKLIRLEVLITIGTFSIAVFNVVTGMLGENLVIPESITQDIWGFVAVNIGTACLCLLVFFSVYSALKAQKVL